MILPGESSQAGLFEPSESETPNSGVSESCRPAHNNRGLYRVNQYRPRVLNVAAAQMHAASTTASRLLSQPKVIELYRSYAAGGNRGIPRAEAEGN